RRAVAVIVKAGLADRHAALVTCQRAQLGEVGVVEAGRLVRVPPDRRVHLREVVGGLECLTARDARGTDRDELLDPGLDRGLDELGVGRLTEAQVCVTVNHRTFVQSSLWGAPADYVYQAWRAAANPVTKRPAVTRQVFFGNRGSSGVTDPPGAPSAARSLSVVA